MRIVILNLSLLVFLLCINCEGCMEEEREALLQIKISINSPVGTAFSTWYGQDCCQWDGVECNVSSSRVIKLFFQHRRTARESWYPNATLFSQFKDLQELYLTGNQLGGLRSPQALHKLKHLQKLDLHDNAIDNSSHLCWGNIPTLHYVDLSRNKLQGHFPQCLCESRSMTELILYENELVGNIHECLRNMTSLRRLSLSGNSFNGSFPSLLFRNLTNIQYLDIMNNQFKDVISFSIFANLSKLSHFDISNNPDLEIETESPTWSPSFSLNHLGLRSCNLNKQSGRNIPSFLSTQYHLEFLDLSFNSLFGGLPSWLLYNSSSELWIRGNNLSGSFPTSQRNMSSQLVTLDISNNSLYGLFPADIKSYFPNLQSLNLSYNMFNGTIHSICELSQLQYLDLSNNDFEGGIPHETFRNLTYLQYLDLSSNNLQGEALPRNSSMPDLKWLYLQRNGFTGSFSDSLSRFYSLQILSIHHNDLSGDLSTSFPVLPQLRGLILKGNRFKGSIPLQLCQMKRLHILDLSENDLSGEIPTCLDNMTSLTEEPFSNDFKLGFSSAYFDLTFNDRSYIYKGKLIAFMKAMDISSNKLTGTIPIQMGELKMIRELNMSNNLLTGQIPTSLANLKGLESLDLSHNALSGKIPSELVDLNFLASFIVSFNNLSGPIPEGNQFGTFTSFCFMGNSGLCGSLIEKECNQTVDKSGEEKKKKILAEIMKSSIVIFVGVLHILRLC